VSAWVLPFITSFKKLKPHSKITICLTPCQYASGREFNVLSHSKDIDIILSPKETLILIKSFPWFRKKNKNGAIMFFGGDPLYTQLLSLKFGFPCFGYSEHQQRLGFLFKHTFYKNNCGDLMSEKIKSLTLSKEEILKKYDLPSNKKILLVFCGSRPAHFKPFFPFMLETIQKLTTKDKNIHPIFVISPFIPDELVNELNSTQSQVIRADSIELMSVATCLVTLPGTNTAEAMYMRLPTLAVIPLNRPDLILFDGLLGLLGEIPVLGIALKKCIISILKRKKKFYTHPNNLLNKTVIPELIDNITIDSLSKTIYDLLNDDQKLTKIKTDLSEIQIPTRVAENIVTKILSKINTN
jgi:hypothetical protein